MRPSASELQALRNIIGGIDPAGGIYPHGSRADDTRRGGDIDIYWQANRPIELKARLLTQYLWQQACDARVDLMVKNPRRVDLAIHLIAVQRGILL